uniref:AIG1-type G domain-containing protein n=1 Tax=Chelydra serpentina TaxID=8475 RepID=A0A8C3SI44_CHESE
MARSTLTPPVELRYATSATLITATGNTILGQKVFDSKLSVKPVTEKCVKGSRSWNGRVVVVVIDTSAILDTKVPDEETSQEICRCVVLSSPGPHALVLVTQLGRYTEEDKDAVRRMQEIFGVVVMKQVIILFTRKEDLGGGSLSDYVAHSDNRDLQRLIDECGNRYYTQLPNGESLFNNGTRLPERLMRLWGALTGVLYVRHRT